MLDGLTMYIALREGMCRRRVDIGDVRATVVAIGCAAGFLAAGWILCARGRSAMWFGTVPLEDDVEIDTHSSVSESASDSSES